MRRSNVIRWAMIPMRIVFSFFNLQMIHMKIMEIPIVMIQEVNESEKMNANNEKNHPKIERALFASRDFLKSTPFSSFAQVFFDWISCENSRIKSSYFPLLRSGRRWFSIISLHFISVYFISIPFPVTIRIFFSSVAITRRSQLFCHFFPIPFSLKSFIPISRSSFPFLLGKSTTTTCSQVVFWWSAKSSLSFSFSDWLSTEEKSFTKYSSFGNSKGFIT